MGFRYIDAIVKEDDASISSFPARAGENAPDCYLATRTGGTADSTTTGPAGGDYSIALGAGATGYATTSSAGGAGGSYTVTGGAGAAPGHASGSGGSGGSITITAGAGGSAASSNGTNGSGGSITLTVGAAGSNSGATAGTAGSLVLAGTGMSESNSSGTQGIVAATSWNAPADTALASSGPVRWWKVKIGATSYATPLFQLS